MKNLLLLSSFMNLLLVIGAALLFLRSGDLEKESVNRELLSETAAVSEEKSVVSEKPVDLKQRKPVPLPNSSLRELDLWEQVAFLKAEGWAEKDAKFYALGASAVEDFQVFAALADSGEEYWKRQDMLQAILQNENMLRESQYQLGKTVRELFGEDKSASSSPIPEEKARAAAEILQDYQMMELKIHLEQKDISLPEDAEALALLKEAKQEDLKALFTPEELFEFEVREASYENRQLQSQLELVEPTEEEYREVFRATRNGESEKVQEILGERRYQMYQRSSEWSYRHLHKMMPRLGLPEERADEVYEVKEIAKLRRKELQENPDLNSEERNQSMQTLQNEWREEIKELLGEDGLKIYEKDVGGGWLDGFW